MRHRLKVSYRSDGRTYAPGDILPEGVPAGDLAYLRDKGFVEPVDDAPLAEWAAPGQEAGGFRGMDAEDDGLGISFPELDETGRRDVKSPEEIQKMRTKDEVYAYALSIGLDLGNGYREESLRGLQEQVVSFQGGAG